MQVFALVLTQVGDSGGGMGLPPSRWRFFCGWKGEVIGDGL